MKLFENGVGRPTNEIKKKRKIFIVSIVFLALIVIVAGSYTLRNVSLSNLEGASANETSITRQQKAVLAVARAYLKNGKQIQYDSYRKNLNITPEDATSKHTCYTVCSGLVYMSYKQALNMELPKNVDGLLKKETAKIGSKSIKPEVIFYSQTNTKTKKTKTLIKTEGTKTTKKTNAKGEFKTFLKNDKFLSLVKPGDILVWEGHGMLIEKIDLKNNAIKVIHATGISPSDKKKADGDSGRYDTKNQKELPEAEGAVHRKAITVNNIKDADRIAIIRYIYTENDITNATLTRLDDYPDIEIAKIIENVENQDYTSVNKTLTYQIRIRNNSSKKSYKNITIKENIDTNLVKLTGINLNTKYVNDSIKRYLSGKESQEPKEISWKIDEIKPGKYVTLQYTVKVKSIIKSGNTTKSTVGNIIKSTGIVTGTKGNIATSKIETLIGNILTSKETDSLKKCFNNYKSCFTKYKEKEKIEQINLVSGKKFVDTLYKASLGIDLGILNISNLTKENSKELNMTDVMKKYLYSNFYGLRIKDYSISQNQKNDEIAFFDKNDYTVRANAAWGDKVDSELSERARTINSSMLKDGDVILTQKSHDSKVKVYIYLNKRLYRYIKENEKASFETIKGNKLKEYLNDLVGDYYIILRPYVNK